jgi:hypothetical protein
MMATSPLAFLRIWSNVVDAGRECFQRHIHDLPDAEGRVLFHRAVAADAENPLQCGHRLLIRRVFRASEASGVFWTTNSPMPCSIRTMVFLSRAKRRSAALFTLWI